jgi:hypothetical protein
MFDNVVFKHIYRYVTLVSYIMLTSRDIQNLSAKDFSFLYMQSIINKETEIILGAILYEEFTTKNKMLLYDLSVHAEWYHTPIMENIKKKVDVGSVYIQNKILVIDWSL